MNSEPSESPTASVTLPGVVEKVIGSPHPAVPERAQVVVEGADELYREIRIDNALKADNGEVVTLKEGDEVKVTVETPIDAGAASQKSSEESLVRRK
jgi:hypothetical protein